jgi:hypothetical protein
MDGAVEQSFYLTSPSSLYSCIAPPVIMAEPMGFYARNGLNITVRRASGWVEARLAECVEVDIPRPQSHETGGRRCKRRNS